VPLLMRTLPYVLPSFMLRASLAPAYANPNAVTEALFRRYRDMMLAPGVRGAIVDRMSQQVLVDPAPLLRRIEAPTLLMWGETFGRYHVRRSRAYPELVISRRRKRRRPLRPCESSWTGSAAIGRTCSLGQCELLQHDRPLAALPPASRRPLT
jgi:pimeloyl-ACP methyl ester carboxylesterase